MSEVDGERRGYQEGFSDLVPGVYDIAARRRKAETTLRVLRDYFGARLAECRVLDVGASTGIIDAYLAPHVAQLLGVDIDTKALAHAREHSQDTNAGYARADALALPVADRSIDVVICAHVYEHVPDAEQLLAEIHRVLKPGGVCYFAAGNRFQLIEPHYRVPLLSAIPRPLAHRLIRRLGIADRYHELHFSLLGLRTLTAHFRRHDYTLRLIREHERFATGYMLPRAPWLRRAIGLFAGVLYPVIPTYIWLLEREA
jgi:ubiquinone/menaquinone biosynthesis C-methylase UbiE